MMATLPCFQRAASAVSEGWKPYSWAVAAEVEHLFCGDGQFAPPVVIGAAVVRDDRIEPVVAPRKGNEHKGAVPRDSRGGRLGHAQQRAHATEADKAHRGATTEHAGEELPPVDRHGAASISSSRIRVTKGQGSRVVEPARTRC